MSVSANVVASLFLAGPGQFAFTHEHRLGLLDVAPNYFEVPNGVRFEMPGDRTGFVVTNLSRHQKTLAMRPVAGGPMKIVYETASLGFSMDVRGGLTLSCSNAKPPYITWDEGTVGPGVPSARAKWLLLTWDEPRPPVLFWFGGNTASATTEETGKGFRLVVSGVTGIVRVRLPFAEQLFAPTSAREFGDLAARIKSRIPMLSQPSPQAKSFIVQETERGIEATWQFDRAGAVLPPAMVAGLRRGSVKLLTPKSSVSKDTFVSESRDIKVLFLARRLLPGLAFVRGEAMPTPATGDEIAQVAQSITDYLCGNWNEERESTMLEALSGFVSSVPFTKDPFSGVVVPFQQDGTGSNEAAAYAYAAAALGKEISWLNGLLATLDWVWWEPPGPNAEARSEASALLSLACALRNEPEARLIGAMANCGAEGGPFVELRNYLYPSSTSKTAAWQQAIESPIRLLTQGMQIVDAPGVGICIKGKSETIQGFDIVILSDQPIKIIDMQGLAQAIIISDTAPIRVRVKPASVGDWEIRIARRLPGRQAPQAAASPRYSAAQR